jgi:2',3'-cyclic-nucleotide 2'-phosphodiesterase (5'-nucleotidase family)
MADVLGSTAAEKYDTVVDAAFLNYGSIRLPALPAGEITLGKIYELCPFDNTMVLMRLTGSQLKTFVDIQAAAGGWPCSGVNYQIRDNRVRDLRVGGKPVSDTIIYSVATLDYVANGGDQCGLLRPLPRKDRGLLFRDALVARLAELHRQGRKLESKLENRVTYAQ